MSILPEKIGNHVNDFFMQSWKPHHLLLDLVATMLNYSLHFFMYQFFEERKNFKNKHKITKD